MISLHLGDCVEFMHCMEANNVDAVVTDPPAGISFMGKEWDKDKGGRDKWVAWMTTIAAECLRVLKPGGYALVWALPRTSHWTATAWEDGGFEVRDRIAYCFGSGFPKSVNVSKQLDKMAGMEVNNDGYVPNNKNNTHGKGWGGGTKTIITAHATNAAREWAGWGTALKPAIEDWWVFRKPLSEATVAANVLRWGCGALNIDASRIACGSEHMRGNVGAKVADSDWKNNSGLGKPFIATDSSLGRWPAHIILDGLPEVEAMFPNVKTGNIKPHVNAGSIFQGSKEITATFTGDYGSAARFFKSCPIDEDDYPPLFYAAKASKSERDAGCEGMKECEATDMTGRQDGSAGLLRVHDDGTIGENPFAGKSGKARNHHPTVKSLSLMRYLINLVTREGSTVLDPFLGSGSTGVAAVQLGRSFIGCELDPDYYAIAHARIANAEKRISDIAQQIQLGIGI